MKNLTKRVLQKTNTVNLLGKRSRHKVDVARVLSANGLDTLAKEDLLRLSTKIAQQLQQNKEPTGIGLPIEIFSFGLSPAASVVKYLKENMELNFHEIGGALKRDERGIWGSYKRASKLKDKFKPDAKGIFVPLDIFANRSYSILESVIVYLRDRLDLTFSEIATLLKKKYSTVYTTYVRAKKKRGGAQ